MYFWLWKYYLVILWQAWSIWFAQRRERPMRLSARSWWSPPKRRWGWGRCGGRTQVDLLVLTRYRFPLSRDLKRRPDSATPAPLAPCSTTQSRKLPDEYCMHVHKAGQGSKIKQTTGSGLKVQRSFFFTVDRDILTKPLVVIYLKIVPTALAKEDKAN